MHHACYLPVELKTFQNVTGLSFKNGYISTFREAEYVLLANNKADNLTRRLVRANPVHFVPCLNSIGFKKAGEYGSIF